MTSQRPSCCPRRHVSLAAVLVTVLLTTAGCASRRAAPAPERELADVPAAAPVSPAAAARPTALTEFEARHRSIADNAGQNGRWAEVVWSLDVLQALRPDDTSLTPRRLQAEQAAQALATERLRQGKLAQQRGDVDAAQRSYLEVLALQPAAASAADAAQAGDALRQLERERIARQHLGISARSTFMRAPVAATRSSGKAGAPGRNDVEHASLLAAQGDVNGAISLLKPVAATSQNDAGARRLLGDLYLRQADTLWPQQRAAAITAIENGLLADPSNKSLRERLAQWKSPSSAPKAVASAPAASAASPATAGTRPGAKPSAAASAPTSSAARPVGSVTR
jgi:tetratricopeptide (TPR) repeat protein